MKLNFQKIENIKFLKNIYILQNKKKYSFQKLKNINNKQTIFLERTT